jgi:hypothetical protein
MFCETGERSAWSRACVGEGMSVEMSEKYP